MSDKMKDMIEFPVMYTFKAMGENCADFIEDVRGVFCKKEVDSFRHNPSSKGNYVSVSVTVEVTDFDELQALYASIKSIKGLKYHL